MTSRLNELLLPTFRTAPGAICQRVPASVSRREFEIAPLLAPITPLPPTYTVAPLLATNWLPLPPSPRKTPATLHHTEPEPVTSARLLLVVALEPMMPLLFATSPPLLTTSRLNAP